MLTYFLKIAVNNVITNNPEPLKIIGYGIYATNYWRDKILTYKIENTPILIFYN
jgi:hypothetical protein